MRRVLRNLCVAVAVAVASPAAAQTLTGTVRDDSGAVLPGAVATVRRSGEVVTIGAADGQGRYRIEPGSPGVYSLEVALPNFGTRRFTDIPLGASETRTVNAVLALTLTADVSVTARRTFRNLAELDSVDGGLLGIANTASEGLVAGRQLEARPIMRTGEVLEAVPGLVISQHSGEGKANQYYLRGFNLDHGTDFATTVAGVPVNMPTHAHGQGYSDVNFLIPELVSAVQFQKGLYSATQGDFSTAGTSHVRYANVLERPLLHASGGAMAGGECSRLPRHESAVICCWPSSGIRMTGRGHVPTITGAGMPLSASAAATCGTASPSTRCPTRAPGTRQIRRPDAPSNPAGSIAVLGIDHTTGGETARYSLSGDWQRTRGDV